MKVEVIQTEDGWEATTPQPEIVRINHQTRAMDYHAGCLGKIRYSTAYDAHKAPFRKSQKRGSLKAYRCGICHGYHYGNSKA